MKIFTNLIIVMCFMTTMFPLHAEELTEAQEERNNKIFGKCMMDHYSEVVNKEGYVDFLHINSEAFVNCLKCKNHSEFISADGGENCDE